MKLENRKEKVTPFSHFLIRVAHYGLFAFALILFSVLIGTIGYYFLGEISWLESFYIACMILTGMGPVVEMKTSSAILFSSFYALYS